MNTQKLTLALLATTTVTLSAQSDAPTFSQDPILLPEVVITATRTETEVNSTAATVSVIDRATIENRQFRTLAEALESLPGVAVVRNGTPGQVTSIFTRGSKSQHTLLTIDGRRPPNMLAGGFDWGNLTLDNIDRIEMVRSSSGALYGGDAIGGVVNLITESGRGLARPEYKVSFEGGSFNSFREAISLRGADGKIDYAFSGSQFNADYPRANNNYRRSSVRGSMGYEIAENIYADIKASYYQTDGGSPGSSAFPSVNDHLKREVTRVSPGIEWNVSDSYTTRAYYTFENQWQPSEDFGSVNRLSVRSHLVDFQNDFEVTDEVKATAGVLFQTQGIERTTTSAFGGGFNAGLGSLAGYGQLQWTPVDNINLLSSLRYERYTDFPSAVSWREGISVKIPQTATTIFGSVARSVSTPTAQDLYFEFPAFGSLGNRDLNSESALTFELGVRQPLTKKLELGVTYFRHEFRDLIQFIDPDGFGGVPGKPENINSALSEGVESTAELELSETLNLSASYTYLTAVNKRTGRRLIRRPRHQASLNVSWKAMSRLTLNSGFQWLLDRQDTGTNVPNGDYFLLSAGANYQATKNVQLWLRGENLADDQFEYTTGFPALRLGVYAGIRAIF
jgi:vitamin B12 transporter